MVPPEDGVGHTRSFSGDITSAGVPFYIFAGAVPNRGLAVRVVNVYSRSLSPVQVHHYRALAFDHSEIIWSVHHAHPRVQASHLYHTHRKSNQLSPNSRVDSSDEYRRIPILGVIRILCIIDRIDAPEHSHRDQTYRRSSRSRSWSIGNDFGSTACPGSTCCYRSGSVCFFNLLHVPDVHEQVRLLDLACSVSDVACIDCCVICCTVMCCLRRPLFLLSERRSGHCFRMDTLAPRRSIRRWRSRS